jgi:hypothetical protein
MIKVKKFLIMKTGDAAKIEKALPPLRVYELVCSNSAGLNAAGLQG